MKTAKRVFLGSSGAEYYLYDENNNYEGYWCCYHQGPLPAEYVCSGIGQHSGDESTRQ